MKMLNFWFNLLLSDLIDITMTEQPAQDPPWSSAASVQMPDTLHVDLPHADPLEARFTICKCLTDMTTEHCAEMEDSLVSCEMITIMANSCLDIIQTFAEAIVDVVIPQVYRYKRIYGTFTPSVLGLTEDRIHTYLGDSVEQGLSNALQINLENCLDAKEFSLMLSRHISETVNSVLALTTLTSTPESRLPVLFVTSCLISNEDFSELVRHFANVLVGASKPLRRAQQKTEDQQSQTVESELIVFHFSSESDLTTLVKTYITRMVKVLKSSQMPHRDVNSSNRRDVCVRVGTNTLILTVEDRESDRQRSAMPSHWGFDAIPGAVPDSDVTKSSSESPPFSSVTVIAATEDRSAPLGPSGIESIEIIADELVQEIVQENFPGAKETDTVQKLRELTDRIFDVVMSGHDYQIPSVPAGTRMCDTVTYRRLREKDVTDPGIVAHTLYLRTEEVAARCAVQVLLWLQLYSELPLHPDSDWFAFNELSDNSDEEADWRYAAGDYMGVHSSLYSYGSYATSMPLIDVIPDTPDPTATQLEQTLVHKSVMTLVVGEILNVIGIRDETTLWDFVMKAAVDLQDVDPELYNYFQAFFMGRHYRDMCTATVSELLSDFGTLQKLQEAVRSGDPRFEAALMRAVRKQWEIIPPHRNTAKKTTCGFFKKFKKLCCKKRRSSEIQHVTSLTRDQDGSQFEDHVTNEEPLKDNTEHGQGPTMSKMAAFVRHMCRRTTKMCCSIAKAPGRPFACCLRPESQ
ncbi:uncharacterized protein LOC119499905 isoform X1 [Sebastes umbrosus]|uniref:uncharacterized protein LOC119499905 isoform X1 n=2 Tax=Sebastes umbrosus TaxID=72105 RepID=UPI00189CD856|nr:uncharacterized protein LOC119499905 isoform X1 [Sebastes umbrosus]